MVYFLDGSAAEKQPLALLYQLYPCFGEGYLMLLIQCAGDHLKGFLAHAEESVDLLRV